MKNNLINHPCF